MRSIGRVVTLLAGTACLASGVLPSAGAQGPPGVAPPRRREQAPGFYRLPVGDFEVTVLSDGTVPQAMDTLLRDISPPEVRALVARDHNTLPLETSINAFLVRTGEHLVLIDAGAGTLFGSGVGNQLVANLRAAGYGPEQVDAVFLTHIHGDHSSGLTVGGGRVFPNAEVRVNRLERDYWLNPEQEARAPAEHKSSFAQARAALGPYEAAGRVRPFDGVAELVPGIATRPVPGHTPGHTYYEVTSRGRTLLLIGDAVHAAEVQFPRPATTIQYDVDPPAAARQRRLLFEEAAGRGTLIGAAHVSFPGLGHVRPDGAGFAWVPLPYRSRPEP